MGKAGKNANRAVTKNSGKAGAGHPEILALPIVIGQIISLQKIDIPCHRACCPVTQNVPPELYYTSQVLKLCHLDLSIYCVFMFILAEAQRYFFKAYQINLVKDFSISK